LAVCEYLRASPGHWGTGDCAHSLGAASEELLKAGGADAAELSTTAVVALVSATGDGADVALARVGDSTAFLLAANGEWTELFVGGPPEGQEAGELVSSTATNVLPVPSGTTVSLMRATESVSTVLGPGAALVLVTDGLANALRDGPRTVAPGLAEVLAEARAGEPSPLALARAADFNRRGAHDDRTIVAVWLRPAL
jgi:serine/threonine protein phosphatase PrpC